MASRTTALYRHPRLRDGSVRERHFRSVGVAQNVRTQDARYRLGMSPSISCLCSPRTSQPGTRCPVNVLLVQPSSSPVCQHRGLVIRLRLPASPNAVQLAGVEDGGNGWMVGLGPVGVAGSFDVPLGHLLLDEPWARSMTADRVQSSQQHGDGLSPSAFIAGGGKIRALVSASGGRC